MSATRAFVKSLPSHQRDSATQKFIVRNEKAGHASPVLKQSAPSRANTRTDWAIKRTKAKWRDAFMGRCPFFSRARPVRCLTTRQSIFLFPSRRIDLWGYWCRRLLLSPLLPARWAYGTIAYYAIGPLFLAPARASAAPFSFAGRGVGERRAPRVTLSLLPAFLYRRHLRLHEPSAKNNKRENVLGNVHTHTHVDIKFAVPWREQTKHKHASVTSITVRFHFRPIVTVR